MMKEILITSSVLILAVLAIRQLFKRVLSRRLQYGLWALVLVRLLVPVSLPAVNFSILTATQPVQAAVALRLERPIAPLPAQPATPQPVQPLPVPEVGPESEVPPSALPVSHPSSARTVGEVLKTVWLIGMAAMGGFFLLSNLAFYGRLRKNRKPFASPGSRKVYLVPEGVIPSPCLFGRSIYITPAVASDPHRLRHVLTHEETHARHLDSLWSLLRCVCLTVYWFDPLVWVAAACSKTDCELACDESVLNDLGENERIPYGQTLLSLIPVKRVSNPMLAATTMTSGKKQLKDRVTRIAKRPRQLAAAALAVAVLAGVVSACTFTGGKEGSDGKVPSSGPEALTGEELRWFNEEFFSIPEASAYNFRNQFANPIILYDRPEDINLYELFYCEMGDGEISDAELVAALGYDSWEDMPCPGYKMTAGEMDRLLVEYTGRSLEETNKVGLDQFTYLEEYDAYYWMHGDTNYSGGPEIAAGVRDGDLVKLYHNSSFAGTSWYCVTLVEAGGSGTRPYGEQGTEERQYYFVSHQECEAPAIPTPLPAWEPEATVSLGDLSPYAAPAVTVTDYPNHYSFNYETSYARWNFDGRHIEVYKAADGVVYAAYEENDIYHVFQSGLPENHNCVFFYKDLLGHDGFWLDYFGPYEDRDGVGTIRDYYYFDGSGVLTLLARCQGESQIIDLDGDGHNELVTPRQLFFQREGVVYEARLDDLLLSACPELSYWDYESWDKYGKCLYVNGLSAEAMWERYLYFDGENLLVYKNEKPTTDHMVDGISDGVPGEVVEKAREYAQQVYQEPGDGVGELDDWRVESFDGPYTYSYGGATVEMWQFNYELHTTTPGDVVLAGGRYMTEDHWVSPGYPGCDALFFEVKGGEYRYLNCRMVQESPESQYVNEQVLLLMEEKGIELPDGSTYAQLWFQKRLDRLAVRDTVRIQYDDGQGNSGTYTVPPREDNGSYYLNQMKDNDVVWSWAQAPAADPAGPSVTLSSPDWYETLRFWKDSGLVMYKQENREPEWYEVQYDGDPAQDVFAYRAYPYYQARGWFDDAEWKAMEGAMPLIPDEGEGQSYLNIAQEWAQAHEGLMTRLSPGGSMSCSYVKVTGVGTLEDMPETWFPWDIVDYPHFAFTYDVAFVPENQDALNTLMAGNTGPYEGGDPAVPEGAFAYSRRGSMNLKDGYWYCGGVGTG